MPGLSGGGLQLESQEAQHGDADGAKSNVLHLLEEASIACLQYICLKNAIKSCYTLCFPDEMELPRGWTKMFLWTAALGCMHQKTVGMFMTVPFLMMGVVESREVLEVVVM